MRLDKLNELFDAKSSKRLVLNERDIEALEQWGYIDGIAGLDADDEKDLDSVGLVVKDLTIDQLNQIIKKAPVFIDLDGKANMRPYLRDFVNFAKKNPEFILETMLVWPERSDYRVEVDGIKAPDSEKARKKLRKFIKEIVERKPGDVSEPDEFHIYEGMVRAWWD